MKKVKIKHIAKKSGMDTAELRQLFLDNGIIDNIDQKTVAKKVAKHFLRDTQGINKYGYSKMWFLDSFWASKLAYFLLWLLALGWLFWSMYQLYADTNQDYDIATSDSIEWVEVSWAQWAFEFETASVAVIDNEAQHNAPSNLPKTGADLR